MAWSEVNINAVPDWKTMYPPEQVGEYLLWLRKDYKFEPDTVIEMKPGMIIPMPPEATLEGFLEWCADRSWKPKVRKQSKRSK